MAETTKEVTVDDLREAEMLIKRAEGRVATRRKRLIQEEIELSKTREVHAELIKAYQTQHCKDGMA